MSRKRWPNLETEKTLPSFYSRPTPHAVLERVLKGKPASRLQVFLTPKMLTSPPMNPNTGLLRKNEKKDNKLESRGCVWFLFCFGQNSQLSHLWGLISLTCKSGVLDQIKDVDINASQIIATSEKGQPWCKTIDLVGAHGTAGVQSSAMQPRCAPHLYEDHKTYTPHGSQTVVPRLHTL